VARDEEAIRREDEGLKLEGARGRSKQKTEKKGVIVRLEEERGWVSPVITHGGGNKKNKAAQE